MGKLKIFHINLRNARIAMDKLTKNLEDYKDAIVSTNEITRKANFIPNLNSLSKALAVKTKTGRTRAAIYIKGDEFKRILITQLSTPDIAMAEITGDNECFILISAYLPPDGNYQMTLSSLANAINKIEPDKKIIICSDTNSKKGTKITVSTGYYTSPQGNL